LTERFIYYDRVCCATGRVVNVLFDLTPKESPEALFGREKELDELARLIKAGRWVAVLGPRMVGKTSLIKAAKAKLDRQAVYVNLWGAKGVQGLLSALVQSINSSKGLTQRIKEATARIEGLSIGPGGISVTAPRKPFHTLWNLLDLLGRQDENIVIELDEVQELSDVSGQLLKVLANIFNTHPHIVFVFSGSMFGLIKTLLNPRSSKSPMYGRPPAELYLQRFDRSQVKEFLAKGFEEYRTNIPDNVLSQDVEMKLDGIPGWLTLYGNNIAVGKLSPEKALRKTVEQGLKVVTEELEHFLDGRDRRLYLSALAAMANPARWSDVKASIEARRGTTVSDSTVNNVLENLIEGMLTEHEENNYRVIDPMLRALLLSGLPS
jgi:AAA+ ATPase superfamily predicted ATPase